MSSRMDDETVSQTSEISEYTHMVYTVWEWNEDQVVQLENSWRGIEDRYDARISFIPKKQAFEIKTRTDDTIGMRQELFKLLQDMSSKAQTVLTVPPRKVERVVEKPGAVVIGKPPPLDSDNDPFPYAQGEKTDGLKRKFRFSIPIGNVDNILRLNREFNEPDAWKEICDRCDVVGDVIPYKKEIHITDGKTEDVDEAVRRLKTLEEIYIRKPVKIEVPLVHHPNQRLQFKLCFLKLQEHSYFRKVFKAKSRDPYIIISAKMDPSNKKWVTPNYEDKGRGITLREKSNRDKDTAESQNRDNDSIEDYNWPAIDPPETPVPWANSPSTAAFSSDQQPSTSASDSRKRLSPTEEEQEKARRNAKQLQMAELRRNRAVRYEGADDNSNGRTSSAWYTPVEEKEYDDDSMRAPIRPMTLEKSPNNNQTPVTNTHGKMLREYNFSQMKNALKPGLEYTRAHKGEVRFFGSFGKVFFTNVDQDTIAKKLWEFSDLKDVLVREHKVKPSYQNFMSDSDDFGKRLNVEGIFGKQTYQELAYFEIVADARNSISSEYKQVFMHVDCAVSLKKVALAWDRHVDIYCTQLDRNFDFAMSLSTRRYIRSDVKPFSTFIKRTAISPERNVISCEHIEDYLSVKSISYKTVSRYKLSYPFIAEVTKIEQRSLVDQSDFNKIVGKCDPNNVYWTIEILSYDNEKHFRENETLEAGKLAKWTVEDVLGEESTMLKKLNEHVKIILKATERCNNLANAFNADNDEFESRKAKPR